MVINFTCGGGDEHIFLFRVVNALVLNH